MTNGSSEGRLEVKNFDFQFVTCEHAGLNGGDVDRPGFGWFLHVPIPFVVMPAHCAAERRPLDTMRQQSHFRNRRCLAGCRRRLGRAFALKPAEEASSITFQIGGRGSRHQRPLPDRPPHPSGFSVRSQRDYFGFNPTAHQWLPFVPPSPRSSIPGSSDIIP